VAGVVCRFAAFVPREGIGMTVDTIVSLAREAMLVTLLTAAPMLLSGMLIGLLISVFQSVTQIQEITLTFVPKIVVVMVVFVVFLPWMVGVVMGFVQPLISSFNVLVL
jgi:flagellar biosynthetic protein FliQ